jgi:Cof subfamily protein (haloacid dehalogenase superfamily)
VKNRSRTNEANAGNDLRSDARVVTNMDHSELVREQREHRCTHADKEVRAQSRRTMLDLALQPDQPAKHRSEYQLFKIRNDRKHHFVYASPPAFPFQKYSLRAGFARILSPLAAPPRIAISAPVNALDAASLSPNLVQNTNVERISKLLSGVKISRVTFPVRLLAVDIDGTLLNSQFHISERDLEALRHAYSGGIEVVLVTGRRHTFALPIAEQLGFDLWLISSNGAVTRSLSGETFHRDLLPVETCRELCGAMQEFRGNTVVTFDKESKGALVLERMDELTLSIQRWLEKNLQYIDFVVPLEKALVADPVQVMFCGPIFRMQEALSVLESSHLADRITVVRTEYPLRDLSIVDVLNRDCSKGHALKRWASHRGIAREQVMAIGDNFNDLEMLAFAGVPFIMGNACAELKARGWPVTASNDECGVAAAIEKVLEGEHAAVNTF